MKVNVTEPVWLSDQDFCTAQQLVEVTGLSYEELEDLIENRVILPTAGNSRSGSFSLRYIVIANRARKLRDDFELDRHGLALAMTLVRHIDELHSELNSLRAQLQHPMINRR
jgi:chaperone modulatory protein CbpM